MDEAEEEDKEEDESQCSRGGDRGQIYTRTGREGRARRKRRMGGWGRVQKAELGVSQEKSCFSMRRRASHDASCIISFLSLTRIPKGKSHSGAT
eukprot:4999670-Pleurochrysis_carterae.AAC.1